MHDNGGSTATAVLDRAGQQQGNDTDWSDCVSEVTAADDAGQLLARAQAAATAFARYDRAQVLRIAEAVAATALGQARRYAEWAVSETGLGVVEHKVVKNEAFSAGLLERYRHEDYVSPRVDRANKMIALPRPAGVIVGVIPSTNPVCTVFFKVIIALLTRNALVVSPHQRARGCTTDAARLLAAAATAAGAPDDVIQVAQGPAGPVTAALMTDPATDLIVATGGASLVRSAYTSGNPALGVGPGNVPVLVDATADLAVAARLIADSKAFDNSLLCTSESVLLMQDVVADRLLAELQRCRAALLDTWSVDRVRAYLFNRGRLNGSASGRLNGSAIGKSAAWIAQMAGVRVPAQTRVLLAPIDRVDAAEPLAREKLCPVLGVARFQSAHRGIEMARAVACLGGQGHSAAIHSRDKKVIMDYGARVPVLRIAVNVGSATGSGGLDTALAPSTTLGTGFAGGSAIGENLEPRHLVNWARIAYNTDPSVPFDDFTDIA
jgi:acetaldehyde dehydrogenase / alcohol dehydrogenase